VFEPRWWIRSDQLLHIVAAAAVDDSSNKLAGHVWKINLDAKTRERLVDYL